MPDYVGNTVEIRGPSNILTALIENKFNFNWIHPIPDTADECWTSRHWTTPRVFNPDHFKLEESSENYIKVWFRTIWSTPYALLAYMTKKWDIEITVCYSGGNTVDYVGRTEYIPGGKVKDVRIFTDSETPKALATFSQSNHWFDYSQWKQMRIDFGIDALKTVDDTPDPSVKMEHLKLSEGTYDSIVCEWDDHLGSWQDKCDICISSRDITNYTYFS